MPWFPLPAVIALVVNTGLLIAFVLDDPWSASAGFALMLLLAALLQWSIRAAARRAAA